MFEGKSPSHTQTPYRVSEGKHSQKPYHPTFTSSYVHHSLMDCHKEGSTNKRDTIAQGFYNVAPGTVVRH